MKKLGLKSPFIDQAIDLARNSFTSSDGLFRLDALAMLLQVGDPASRLELEHFGVNVTIVPGLGVRLGIRNDRMKEILGVPWGQSCQSGQLRLQGTAAFTALALIEVFGKALQIFEDSTTHQPNAIDAGRWLGKWLESPQPAISNIRPLEIIALPTGLPVLLQVIGAMNSGAYL